MAQSTEKTLKALNIERADIVEHIEKVRKRSEGEQAKAAKQTENLNKRLVDVNAKIAALGTPEVAS
jgi:hypothetical protein